MNELTDIQILLCTLALLGIVVVVRLLWSWRKQRSLDFQKAVLSPFARQIVDSLQQEPETWQVNGYYGTYFYRVSAPTVHLIAMSGFTQLTLSVDGKVISENGFSLLEEQAILTELLFWRKRQETTKSLVDVQTAEQRMFGDTEHV